MSDGFISVVKAAEEIGQIELKSVSEVFYKRSVVECRHLNEVKKPGQVN
jgi:hypothetical protein